MMKMIIPCMFLLTALNVFAQSDRSNSTNTIKVVLATYGHNFLQELPRKNDVVGNATKGIASYCNGKVSCRYFVSRGYLGNPFPDHAKSFHVQFKCGDKTFKVELPEEADHKYVDLNCGEL